MIGGNKNGSLPNRGTQLYSFKHEEACQAIPLPEALDGGNVEVANGQVIACTGLNNNCYVYDWHKQVSSSTNSFL